MSTFVGKQFPDVTVKAIDEMGDAFQINVLQQAIDNKKKLFYFGIQKISHLFVQQKFMRFKKLLRSLRKEIQS